MTFSCLYFVFQINKFYGSKRGFIRAVVRAFRYETPLIQFLMVPFNSCNFCLQVQIINGFYCVYFFRQGSVIADVDLQFAENATDVTPETLRSELPDSGVLGNFIYDPQSAQVQGT